MSVLIYVDAYSGYRANERPRQFTLDDDIYDIAEVEDRWYEPDAEYFRVRTTEDKRYILRYDELAEEWTLQSGFDGDELLKRPNTEIILIGEEMIGAAERRIACCEMCRPDASSQPATNKSKIKECFS